MNCPECQHPLRGDGTAWTCPQHGPVRPSLFLSYARRDAAELARRLCDDLEHDGYRVWQDTREIRPGSRWEEAIVDGLRRADVVVALLSPAAVRRSGRPDNPDGQDSVCLDEISFARFQRGIPIVPVVAIGCEPPLSVTRLQHVDFSGWPTSEVQYQAGLQQLRDFIHRALRGDPPVYRSWDDRLRPLDFGAFLSEERRDFSGREWLLAEIDAWRTSPGGPALLITGDPGVGKSALVAELVHRNPDGQVLAYHCCLKDTKKTLVPGCFVRSLAALLAGRLRDYADRLASPSVEEALGEASCARDPASAFEEGILGPLAAIPVPGDGGRYLLIDALDEALALRTGPTIVDVLASRLERLPPWLRLVATTRKEPTVLDLLRGLRARELDAHDPRNLRDVEAYALQRLSSPPLREKLAAGGCPAEDACRALLARSGGNFLYVRQALTGLGEGDCGAGDFGALPQGLAGYYAREFDRLFPGGAAFAEARPLLEAVVAAREPLDVGQLARAAGAGAGETFPALLRKLAAFLPQRQGRRGLYHQSLADWLTDPDAAGVYAIDVRAGHGRLAGLCLSEHREGVEGMSAYARAHLPRHLAEAARWDDLLAAVTCDDLGLLARWTDGAEFQEGLDCLTGLIGHLRSHRGGSNRAAGLATQVARIHSFRGDYAAAERWLRDALAWSSWWGGRRVRAVALHELGSLLLYRGEMREAERAYRRALRRCTLGWPRYPDEAAANLLGLATASRARGHSARALRFAGRALEVARRVNDGMHTVAAHRTLAILHWDLEQFAEAGRHLEVVDLLLRSEDLPVERAAFRMVRGWVEYHRAELGGSAPTLAADAFQGALAEARRIGHRFCSAEARLALARCALRRGDPGGAERWLGEAEATLPGERDCELDAVLRLVKAAVLHRRGDLAAAGVEYEAAVRFCQGHSLPFREACAWVGMGSTHRDRGAPLEAEACWKRALSAAAGCAPLQARLVRLRVARGQDDPGATSI